jgi:isopentenyl-diphosphate delta-isomerase
MTPREDLLVELVSDAGEPVGIQTVLQAHTDPGALHRAFSVLLFDPAGRMLLQRRAATKTRFPLRWANACCGHPGPGEDVVVAAGRRLAEEIGVRAVALTEVGVYSYIAADPESGMVEREYDHVLVGQLDGVAEVAPDAAEVAEVRWVDAAEVMAGLRTDASSYAPWLAGVLAVAARHSRSRR